MKATDGGRRNMDNRSMFRVVMGNVGWIAASIFLALVVWLAANMSNNPLEERDLRNIPISVQIPDGYVITEQNRTRTQAVRIRTQRSEWSLLTTDDVIVTANLNNCRLPGECRIELEADVIDPRHGKIVSIRPSTVRINVDQTGEKRVPLRSIITNEPPLGYSLAADPNCTPTEIVISGGAQQVNRVTAAVIQFDLANQMNPITGRLYDLIPVNDVGDPVANVTLSPARVACSLAIEPRTDVTQVSVLAKVLGNPPDGYFFEGYVTSPTTIGLSGDPETIAAMQGVVSTLPVNLSSHTENYTVEVPLDLPDGVTIVPENQLIHVTVFISPTANSRRYENIPVEIDGLDPTLYRATVMPEQVSVLIVGPEALLPEPTDIQVLVDLTELGPGTHQVNAQGVITQESVDGSEMTITIEPAQLTVTIESLATPSRSDE